MSATTIIFIDSRVADYQALVADLPPGTEWFLLDASADGVMQMAAVLSGYTDLAAVHVVSHGSAGSLLLGNALVDASNVEAYSQALATIGSSLSSTGDLLLYGCDVGAGAQGEAFVAQLAALSGADVAASTDLTGGSAGGGDWNLELVTGSIEATTLQVAGDFTTLATYTGTAGADSLTATGNVDDVMSGLAGNDTLSGVGGNDAIDGGDGNDSLLGGNNDDSLTGGAGTDTLVGGNGIDTFNVDAGSDTITDLGTGGTDVLVISAGATATATVSAAWTATAGSSNAGTATLSSAGFAVNLALATGANGWSVTNTGAATTLTGSANADTLVGGANADTLVGGAGNDSLTGGAGVDTFTVGSGSDTLTDLGNGADVLVISAGATATATVGAAWTATAGSSNAGTATLSSAGFAVDLSLATGANGWSVTNTGAATTLTGSANADTLAGGANADTLVGGAGNDSLTGGAGADTFTVASGSDTLTDLGNGADVLVISAGATATATVGAAWTATAGSSNAGTATLSSAGFAVDLSLATGANGWSVTNTGAATTLTGSANADTLVGGANADTLVGGAGNDSLTGGAGADSLTGGAGNDSFNVDSGTDSVTDLNNGDILVVSAGATATATVANAFTATASSSNAGTATLSSAGFAVDLSLATGANGWSVTNTGAATTLTGSASADTLVGGANADTLVGGAGNDSLTGGAGVDTFTVGSGSDTITDLGTGGADVLTISAVATANATVSAAWTATAASSNAGTASLSTAGFAVNLASAGGSTGWSVTNTGAATTLTGSGRADTLAGGSGADVLDGGAGADSLTGGAGDDTYVVDNVGDVVVETAGQGNDTIQASTNFTLSTGVENLTLLAAGLSGTGNDQANSLSASLGTATLQGGAGADQLSAALEGNDLTGGDGLDRFILTSLQGTTGNVVRDLLAGESLELADLASISSIGAGNGSTVLAGQVQYATDGADTLLYVGLDANAGADAVVRLSGLASGGGLEIQGNALKRGDSEATGTLSVTGTAQEGSSLVASLANVVDADGSTSTAYRWQEEIAGTWTDISGATAATLSIPSDQSYVGKVVRVVATTTDAQGGTTQFTGDAQTILNADDAPTGSVTISGTAAEDQVLTADASALADADGLGSFSYQWRADGADIAGATSSSYTLTQAEVGKLITVAVSYTDGFGKNESVTSAATAAVANVDDAVTGSVTLSGTATQGQILTAANDFADEDGVASVSYQWQADGVDIAGATSSSFALTQAEVGKLVRVVATVTDEFGNEEVFNSAATAAVANVDDAPTGSVTISGTAAEDQVLTADASALADADGLGSFSYQWMADGADIAGATSSSYTLTQAEVGKLITVSVEYTDGFGKDEKITSAATAAVANVNDAPAGGVSIDGTATQGQTLTANTSVLTDGDGVGSFSYQWQADGTAIAGATSSSFTLTQAEVGKAITVVVSYTDNQGTLEDVTSTATASVQNVNDAVSGTVTISGTALQGETLTADTSGLSDADGLGSFSYQWRADGTDIAGATGPTLLLTAGLVGAVITVRVSFTDQQGTSESVTSDPTGTTINVNDAPTGAVTISGTAAEDQVLTANASGLADADGLGSFSYQWMADGADIVGATSSTYTLTQAEVGKVITVSVAYVDGYGYNEKVTSAATAAVANVDDAVTGSVTLSGTATQGQILTAANDFADEDGVASVSYQWQAGGVDIAGATSSTYTLTQGEVGKLVRVVATVTDDFGNEEVFNSAATAAVANVDDAPTGSVTISGTATEDQVLTADASALADADGLGSFSYQWMADGADIAGATSSTYTLTQAEVGKLITVSVEYTDGYGKNESVTSAATAAVGNVDDAVTGSVTVSGTATQGQILTAANDFADEDGVASVSYQWQADGVDIAGATSSSYALTQAEVGKLVRVVATVTDDFGNEESVTSAATAAVANAEDAPTGSVTISGTATEDQVLTADASALADADGLGSFSYQWRADGTDIAGATSSSYTLTQAEVGKLITVAVSYTDGFGKSESVTSAATAAVGNVNDAVTGSVTVSGTATEDQVLTADASALADADGIASVSYQWQADGVDIAGATSSSYTLTQAEVGKVVRVVATVTDDFGNVQAVNSAATVAVANVDDEATGTLSVTGTAQEGSSVVASLTDVVDADGSTSTAYRWQEQIAGVWTDIAGVTTATVLIPGDQSYVGKVVRVVATTTDALGGTTEFTSAAQTILNADDAPTGSVTISGTATEDQVLTADASALADADGLGSFSYQWRADGTDIAGATSSSYTLTQAEVGKLITVAVSYTDGFGKSESVTSAATAAVANLDDAPTGSVTISGTATEDQVLTADASALADADGIASVSYQWQADGVDIAGATSSSYTLTQAEVGKVVRVVATVTDDFGNVQAVNSAATVAVANVDDEATGTLSVTGTAQEGSSVVASLTDVVDADGSTSTAYRWQEQIAGVWTDIAGVTTATVLIPGDQSYVGKVVRVVATTTDALGGTTEFTSAAQTILNADDAPTGSVTISGTATEDQVLTADASALADADGLGSFSYQWRADGTDIAGATGSSYTLTQAEVGKLITVSVSYTDGYGKSESVTSAATAAVANLDDAPTGSVTVSGTATEDQVLTADASGLADADGLGSFNYQWRADGVDIAGATSSSYTLTQAEVGKLITVSVLYTDGYGKNESVTSAATAAVANVDDEATGTLSVTGTAQEGGSVVASLTDVVDADGSTSTAYRWQEQIAGVWTDIAGVTTATVLIPGDQSYVGKVVRVVATTTDALGGTTEFTSAAQTILNVNDAPTGSVTISGTTSRGQVLTASNTLADGDGLGTVSYQWRADGADIAGATSSTYTLTQAEVDKVISVVARYTDGGGTLESVTSASTTAVNGVVQKRTMDFDGDGKADLLWRNGSTGANTLWKGASSATSQTLTTIADQNWKVAGTGDFDGDGKSDLLWRNVSTGANTIWKSGNSATTQAVASQTTLYYVAGTGDFDGDGKSDIFWRNAITGTNEIWKSGSAATVVSTPSVPNLAWQLAGVGDFDGDGKSDVLWRNGTTGANLVWKSGSNVSTQTLTTIADQNWQVAGVGDFDADGRSDILWRNKSTGANSIWNGGESGNSVSLATVANQAWQVAAVEDFTGDGKSDIVWRNASTGASQLWSAGSGSAVQNLTTVATTWQVAGGKAVAPSGNLTPRDVVGDFDGDGFSDILWRNTSTGANTIWKSGSSGSVQAVATLASSAWKVVGTGDFNGDGRADILWRNATTGANAIWKNGDISNAQTLTSITNLAWKVVGTGDFDNDGYSDILWRNTSTGANAIWRKGDSSLSQSLTTIADQNWKVLGIGDFDGDGKSDVLWRNTTTGANTIWKSGNSTTTQSVTAITNMAWQVAGVGDFNGDGKADILWRNGSTGANSVWLGGNSATTQAVTSQGLGWAVEGVGDYNGDGKADILWRNTTTGQDQYWSGGNSATTVTLTTLADLNWQMVGTVELFGP